MMNATAHFLRYNHCEDEADKIGVTFAPNADGLTVDVFDTFSADYSELSDYSRRTMKVSEARALWARLVSEVDYGEKVYTHIK